MSNDQIKQQLDRIEGAVHELKDMIHGQGDSPGHKGRIARLEDRVGGITKFLWMLAAGVIAALASAFGQLFR